MADSFRIALANLPYPATPDDAVARVIAAVADAGRERANMVCFGEAYIPGYRGLGHVPPPPDASFLERARKKVAESARRAGVTVILGTERMVDGKLRITAMVANADGSIEGFQDKVQLDPSEDETYSPGSERRVFQAGALRFGISICHEGWRYPETVRWAARRGAQVIFHPHYHPPEPDSYRPTTFADPANTFHEKAMFCRAAENTCYFASVNYCCGASPTTSAIANPDGTLHSHQPYGKEGLLIADIDLDLATGLLASRLRA